MSTIVLFHSALGRRPAILRLAKQLEAQGHTVHTPDLFDGQVFDELEPGVAKRDSLGIPELMRRTAQFVEGLPPDLLYVGFSMGAASAQWLAATRPGARGAVLLHAALPTAQLGVPVWPADVPVQVHYAEQDPWVDAAVIDALRAVPAFDIHVYPGDAHLFTDDDSPEYYPETTAVVLEHLFRFIAERSQG